MTRALTARAFEHIHVAQVKTAIVERLLCIEVMGHSYTSRCLHIPTGMRGTPSSAKDESPVRRNRYTWRRAVISRGIIIYIAPAFQHADALQYVTGTRTGRQGGYGSRCA